MQTGLVTPGLSLFKHAHMNCSYKGKLAGINFKCSHPGLAFEILKQQKKKKRKEKVGEERQRICREQEEEKKPWIMSIIWMEGDFLGRWVGGGGMFSMCDSPSFWRRGPPSTSSLSCARAPMAQAIVSVQKSEGFSVKFPCRILGDGKLSKLSITVSLYLHVLTFLSMSL